MGVAALWPTLDSIKQSKSLLVLATEHRLQAHSEGLSGRDAVLTLGVDMGTCMAECNAGALCAGVNHQQAGGGLYIFFKRLTEYIKTPAAFIFIFDGPARPSIKRGHQVRDRPIWWAEYARDLIDYFGYQAYQAPGEAEAELAQLNRRGYIDGVITSDSDAIPFGTRYLLRSVSNKDRKYPLEHLLYEANPGTASPNTNSGLPLSRDGFVLFALLCGGDYDDGITGCGPTTAMALARCGFGDQLVTGFTTLHGADYDEFLAQWRYSIRLELFTNSQEEMPVSRPRLAAAINDNFPNQRALSLYVNPLTSWSPGQTPPNAVQWALVPPSIPDITDFCVHHFYWEDIAVCKRKMKAYLWEGIFLQTLYSPWVEYIPDEHFIQLPGHWRTKILSASHLKRRGQYVHIFGDVPQLKLVVSVSFFINLMGPSYSGIQNVSEKITVWPPSSLASLMPQHDFGDFAAAEPDIIHEEQVPSDMEGSHADILAVDHEDGWVQVGDHHWYIDLTND